MAILDSPVSSVARIGKPLEQRLKKLGIQTCRDAFFYFPFRFDDFSRVVPISEVTSGATVTICGEIQLIRNRRSRKRRMILTEALVSDAEGSVKVLWFNQQFLTKNLKSGDRVSLSGTMSEHVFDLTLINPAYEKIRPGEESTHTGRLVPIYRLTEGLTQKQFRSIVKAALAACGGEIVEYLPVDLLQEEGFLDLRKSIETIHFPGDVESWNRARTRLAFDELFMVQLEFRAARKNLERFTSFPCAFQKEETQGFISSLSFQLTEGQRSAAWEIVQDLTKSHPMNRLLDGDVGSGKTAVSAIAAFVCARSGYQIAYMAPTELLARQTYETFSKLFETKGIACALITGKNQESGIRNQEKIAKKGLLQHIRQGEIGIVVGTHALLQATVKFSKLALAIVDEQHRFGVNQRKSLRGKNDSGEMPHLLSMTATPIPRSLALALYGDLDVSALPEVPKGRKKTITKLVPSNYREWTYQFIRKEIRKGRQAFVICPLIDPSDVLGVRSTTQEYERLKREVFPDLALGMLHGRMKGKGREETMSRFAAGELDILVSTSVIEVGIDIPNATVMLIEGAERFGLAQLHQFRGRVGRGEHQSYCFLFPGDSAGEEVLSRLHALVNCTDGFKLAEEDLKQRGSGDLLGERQSGLSTLKLASFSDARELQKARGWVDTIFPKLEEYPLLKKHLVEYEHDAHLE